MHSNHPIFEPLESRVLLSTVTDCADLDSLICRIDGGNGEIAAATAALEATPSESLISIGESWQYLKGIAAPPVDWAATGFDDSSWLSGPTGIGYSDDITYATDLPDMLGGYLTFYARTSFDVVDAGAFSALELGIQYDDGFVAYLNGIEVARSPSMGTAGSATAHDQEAASNHNEEAPEETYPIPLSPGQLLSEGNILAIEVHNIWINSSDAGMIPRLVGITNLLPAANVNLSYSSTDTVPTTVTFYGGNSQDSDGTIVDYFWDFDDGSPVQGPEVVRQHEYVTPGIYQAMLTVTDDDGDTDTISVSIRVGPGDTYCVADPRGADGLAGTADDVDASDTYPGTIDQPFATLQKAAGTAVLGDTVLIRGGTYNEPLVPQNSGGPQRNITFRNYTDEAPTITGASLRPAINISYRKYITLQGLTVSGVDRWLYAIDAHYNILEGNHFSNAFNPGGSSKGGLFFQEATYNKILNNVIENNQTQDNLSLHVSDHNLIEGNTITHAGHTLWTIKAGNFNVLRDNYFYNPWQKIGEVYDAWGAGFDHGFYVVNSTKHNLITGNVFDYTPSSGNSSPYAGIQYAGQDGIIRQNLFYDTVGPGLSMTLYPDEAKYNTGNRVYNNVFSQTDFAGISMPGSSYAFEDNVIKNNIMSNSSFVANDTRWNWYTQELDGRPVQLMTGRLDGFVFENNDLWAGQGDESYLLTYGTRSSSSNPPQQTVGWWEANHPELFAANSTADPKFIDESGRDYHLQADSPLIDAGTFLTRTLEAGSGTAIPVADVSYFYDGYGIPGEIGDEIQFAGQTETAIVVGIDYEQDILYIDRPMTWMDNVGVTLWYTGEAPDMGAIEYKTVRQSPVAYLFYNNSSFDGDSADANASDDNAIATDKSALLSGQTATFANYTNYSRGINGIMVDIDGSPGTPELADFGFKAGTDPNPNNWLAAQVPSVTVRSGQGVGGTDRVTIIWADYAMTDQWLQVIVKAGGNIGLPEDYVFYFGNIVGDTGGDGQISSGDYSTLVSQFGQRENGLVADFNRDARTGIEDFAILRAGYGDSLAMPTVPDSPPSGAPQVSASLVPVAPAPTVFPSMLPVVGESLDGGFPDRFSIAPAASWPAVNLLIAPRGNYAPQSRPIAVGSVATIPHRAATAEDDLRVLSDDLPADETVIAPYRLAEADDLMFDVLVESPITILIQGDS